MSEKNKQYGRLRIIIELFGTICTILKTRKTPMEELLLVKLHAEASHIKNREHLKKFAIDTQCANHSP